MYIVVAHFITGHDQNITCTSLPGQHQDRTEELNDNEANLHMSFIK